MNILSRFAAAFALLLTVAQPALAEAPPPSHPAGTTHAVSAEDAARLAATLRDDKARARLLADLDAMAATSGAPPAQEASEGWVADLSEAIGGAGEDIMQGLAELGHAPEMLRQMGDRLADAEMRRSGGRVLLELLAVLAAGWTAQRLALLLLARARQGLLPKAGASLAARLPLVVAHAFIDLLPIAAFLAAGLATTAGVGLEHLWRKVALMLTFAWCGLGLVLAVLDWLAAPRQPARRLLPVDDETAEYLEIWARRFAAVGLLCWLAAQGLPLAGLSAPAAKVLAKAAGLVMAGLTEVFILQNRAAVAGAFCRFGERHGPQLAAVCGRLAQLWHVLAAAYVGAVYLAWAVPVAGGPGFLLRATALSAAILVLAAAVATLVDRGIDRAFALSQDVRERFPGLESRANRYLPALRLFFRGVVVAMVPLALLEAWGVASFAWLASDLGQRILGTAIGIAVTLAVAVVVWEVAVGAIERLLAADVGGGVRRAARLRTLLPLARSALLVTLVAMVTMIVLAQLGINIGPLLAGAGMVGVAIGFGAQKLVQDVITGAFILFEDTMAVGDAVKLDSSHSGTVESMTIRAIRLRDLQGAVHTIPFSAVGTVVNMSRDFAFAVFDIGIAYHEDVDRVNEVLRDLGAEMQADADWGARIVEPLQVMGIDRFEASSVVLRARFKTQPLAQWEVMREFHRRLKRRFDELGIEIPFPQTKVWLAEPISAAKPA